MAEKISDEKEAVITALGAKVLRVPVLQDSFSPNGLFGTVSRLRKEIPNSFVFDQVRYILLEKFVQMTNRCLELRSTQVC